MSRARPLHLVAYDIADPGRLQRVHHAVLDWSTGGQKSVHECWMSPGERAALCATLARLIDPQEDSVLILRLDPRMGLHTLGIAVKPRDEPFFYVG
ncbi:MAG: CRISPR-associated endonuclease Cas2 [Rhodospirillaceae bacterium]|nr:CRISPR-associated endonuclease Cas2 [Rhodospirillaceae bacterium]